MSETNIPLPTSAHLEDLLVPYQTNGEVDPIIQAAAERIKRLFRIQVDTKKASEYHLLLEQAQQIFLELFSSAESIMHEKVLYLDYLTTIVFLYDNGVQKLISTFEKRYGVVWTELPAVKQQLLFGLLIQEHLQKNRMKNKVFKEMAEGKQGVSVGFELEYFHPNKELLDEIAAYLSTTEVAVLNPPSASAINNLPLSTGSQLTPEYLQGVVELITSPSVSEGALREILLLAKLDGITADAGPNVHMTVANIQFDEEHPDMVEVRAMMSAYLPEYTTDEIRKMKDYLTDGLPFQHERVKKASKCRSGVAYIPFFKIRNSGRFYRGRCQLAVEFRSFTNLSRYSNWFTAFAWQANYALCLSYGIQASHISPDQRTTEESELARAWDVLKSEWQKLIDSHGIDRPPTSDFFISIPTNWLDLKNVVIAQTSGYSRREINSLFDEVSSLLSNPDQQRLISFADFVWNKGVAPADYKYSVAMAVVESLGMFKSASLYYDTIQFTNVNNAEFNRKLKAMMKNYRSVFRKITHQQEFSEIANQRKVLDAIRNTILVTLTGSSDIAHEDMVISDDSRLLTNS